MLTTMKMANTILMGVLIGLIGCVGYTPNWGPLTFPSSIHGHDETGSPPEPEPPETTFSWIKSPAMDDGFGSALAFGHDRIWIGSPHGDKGSVYKWDGTELDVVLSENGRLGSHLSWSANGLWAAAPLFDGGTGTVFQEDGTMLPSLTTGTGPKFK